MHNLENGYTLRDMTAEEFHAAYVAKHAEYFKTSLIVDVTSHLSDEERQLAQVRSEAFPKAWRMQWALEHDGVLIGWTFGYQVDHETLYMCNTAIDAAHRGKGLYTRILAHVLEHAQALGFQLVTSKHYASNNAVLVPKLKSGFIITSLALDDKYGLMVHLTKYMDPEREANAIRRIGETR
ncbi:MAG: GNAT family N-acetyltransferase [Candidatus Kapabacteria bacterium]|nr:GNAT family N-acetyltransferase [Candidatus Kapabacteria bacterium]